VSKVIVFAAIITPEFVFGLNNKSPEAFASGLQNSTTELM
jgi:hypothetical protein